MTRVSPRAYGRRARHGAIDGYRIVIAIVMVFALVTTLSWLQNRFDSSDHKKAEELVRSYSARPHGPKIADAILARHPEVNESELGWSSQITSGCFGTVRVSAYIPKKAERAAKAYAFDVRLTDSSIHPTDPDTVEILKALTATDADAASSTVTKEGTR
jgi:hypothetical protein